MVLAATLASANAQNSTLCGTPAVTAAEKLRQFQSAKSPEVFRDARYVAYSDAAGITWTFTVAGNPAHPAVVCRRIVGPEGNLQLETNASCDASRQACDAMMAEFAKLNAAMLEAMKSRK
jgi:hypothetical protein